MREAAATVLVRRDLVVHDTVAKPDAPNDAAVQAILGHVAAFGECISVASLRSTASGSSLPGDRAGGSATSYYIGVTRIDWSRRAEYVRSRHGIDLLWADEAVDDAHAVWLVPDPASRTGSSLRVIGYSTGARAVLTVILVAPDADPGERPIGDWWGANAWVASARDRRRYGEED
jgi:hypothetical protein